MTQSSTKVWWQYNFGKAAAMRGPGYKISGDVRRTWRCSICGRERKLLGDVTTQLCDCRDGAWMQIVAERTVVPRPLQRPSDVERRPIDFGIEPPPPAPPKPEATIVKSAISHDPDPVPEPAEPEPTKSEPTLEVPPPNVVAPESDDNWGEGIL